MHPDATLTINRGTCFAAQHDIQWWAPDLIQAVADNPDQVTLTGPIDQIVLAAYAALLHS
jgi:hypothetical protein